MSAWQPIETAPRDGTYVLVSNGFGSWIAHWSPVSVSGYRFDQPLRSVMLNCYHIPMAHRYAPPTLWMPLPAPSSDAVCASLSPRSAGSDEPTGA